MKRIPIKAILIVYMTPLLMATDCSCNCQDESYEIQYTGVEITAWDTSKFHNKLAEGEVSKNAFGIKIYVKYDQNGIAFSQKPKHTSHASFGIAYAWSCDCIAPEYHFPDPIKSIHIVATDTANQKEVDVTSNFTTRYGEKNVTIPELLKEYKESKQEYLSWQLDLTDATNIPNKVVFVLTVTLDSGKTFRQETAAIVFSD